MNLTPHVTTTPAASNPQTESQLLCLQPHWQWCTCITSSFHTRWSETAAPQTAIITSLPPRSFNPNVPPGLSASKQHRTPSKETAAALKPVYGDESPNRTKVCSNGNIRVSISNEVGGEANWHILAEYQPFFIHFFTPFKDK